MRVADALLLETESQLRGLGPENGVGAEIRYPTAFYVRQETLLLLRPTLWIPNHTTVW